MFKRFATLLFLILFFMKANVFAAEVFPYINANLELPSSDDPFPGLGNGYSSLGSGIRSVLWNPASLAKIKESEGYFGATGTALSSKVTHAYTITDSTFEVSGSGGLTSQNFANKVLYTSDQTATSIETRTFNGDAVFSPFAGTDYKQAIKISDMFAFGISSKGQTNVSLATNGNFPTQYLSEINLYNTANFLNSGTSVGGDGKMSYTYNGITYETATSA